MAGVCLQLAWPRLKISLRLHPPVLLRLTNAVVHDKIEKLYLISYQEPTIY